jgi:hypothetical protein
VEKVIIIAQNLLGRATVTLYGDMFQYYTDRGLYLSGNSPSFSGNNYDFYSKIRSLSANFKPFTGRPIEYSVINENEIQFKLPDDIPLGDYDVIFCNPAGYAKASNTRNFDKITITEFIPELLSSVIPNRGIITMSGKNIETIKKYLDV